MEKNFVVGAHTDVGRVRHMNEDFSGVFETPNGHVFVVCDGMGGHLGGSTASRLAVDSIRLFLNHQFYADPQDALRQAIYFANDQINRYAAQNPELEGMGTTCVLALLRENLVFYVHAGDSRLYLLRRGQLTQLTKDHSYVQQLLDKGAISKEEAAHHPKKGEITRNLGMEEGLEVVVSEVLPVYGGDTLLLCSDSLHGMLGEADIQKVLKDGSTPPEKARRLIQLANTAGGADNITVEVIEFTGPQPAAVPTPLPPVIEEPVKSQIPVSTPVPPPVVEKEIPPTLSHKTVKENPAASAKNPRKIDWALVILLVLFGVVLVLFLRGWDYLGGNPAAQDQVNPELLPPDQPEPVVESPQADSIQPSATEPVNPQQPTPQKTSPQVEDSKKKQKQPPVSQQDTLISYTVGAGENLNRIAERFNLKPATVKKLNKIEDDNLQANQKIKLKVRAVHSVKSGDVLSVISSRYRVSRELIRQANNMPTNKTTRGEKLIIPLAKKQ
jgi:serine/threonine protein phosphatase PrpC/LysM repeat protein